MLCLVLFYSVFLVCVEELYIYICIYHLHFLEGVDQLAIPRLNGVHGNGFDARDDVSDRLGHESSEDEASQFSMVITLVKKDSIFAQHPLLTSRKCRLKEMSFSHQHKLHSFRARKHHTRITQYMGLENWSIPKSKQQNSSKPTSQKYQ